MPRGDVQTSLRARRERVTLAEVMRVAARGLRVGIRTTIPCRVLTYDPTIQKAKIIAEHIVVINDDGGEGELPPMVLENIPVRWLAASAGASWLTLPLLPGDTGYLAVSDRSIERWMSTNAPVDPAIRHTHNPIDGIFEPGLHADAVPLSFPTDLTAAVLESSLIKLGVGALPPLFAARVTDPTSADTTMAAWITAVTLALSTIALAAGGNVPVITVPTPPIDFGLILSGSAKTVIE